MEKKNSYHTPVLLEESIAGLNIRPGGVYIDVTFGGGGHSRAILNAMQGGRLFAFDQDADALANAPDDSRLTLIHAGFSYIKNFMMLHGVSGIDGLLADLGVSSHQIDAPERGFSTRFDGVLDMRMDRNNPLTAATIINTYSESDLAKIFREYGELSQAGRLAKLIVDKRNDGGIDTTGKLRQTVSVIFPEFMLNKFLARIFQALRIAVNNEMETLTQMLAQATALLKPGGRLVVLTYHSLEDRIVKNFMKSGKADGTTEEDFYGNKKTPYIIINKKPILPSAEEQADNNRSRSAKLRIAEKK